MLELLPLGLVEHDLLGSHSRHCPQDSPSPKQPLQSGRHFRLAALSPLGQAATRLVAPRLGAPKPVPGPPKRFAQAIGAAMTLAIALVALVGHDHTVADVLLVGMIAAAGLESILAFCVGCQLFALLMRAGLIPESVCLECANVGVRRAAAPGGPAARAAGA